MATTVTFAKDAVSRDFPAPEPGVVLREVKHQGSFLLASGTRVVYDKGVDRYEAEITLPGLTETEYANLQDFFHTTADGVLNTWTFTDSRGNTYTARFLEPTLQVSLVGGRGDYDVTLLLELDSMGV